MINNLGKKLNSWLDQGLITEQQYEAIRAFEQGEGSSNQNWWLYSLLILGCSIIGLGIISLIAANWAVIPDGIKLGTAFSLLGLLALMIFWQAQKPDSPWRDALISGFIILCL
ncbi:MAG: DUF2157 domain-containing protein, partial [Thiolinea sp.]